MRRFAEVSALAAVLMSAALIIAAAPSPVSAAGAEPRLPSLDVLSIETLRARAYAARLVPLERLHGPCPDGDGARTAPHAALMAGYGSDGLRVYARVDLPNAPAPAKGYPVVVFAHGWAGADAAPTWPFACDPRSIYGEMIDAYVQAGFVVISPGFRGHGTVAGRPAEGLDWVKAFDNGSYLSPSLYAIDTLNLISALGSMADAVWLGSGARREGGLRVDLDRVFVKGHSQGGDVALIVLAATGRGARSGLRLAGGSIWAGTFPDRFTQLRAYDPMQSAPEAFLAGDGTWTGTARGRDGRINPNFVFGWPSDTIGTPDPAGWTWQTKAWSQPSVRASVERKIGEMYEVLNTRVEALSGLTWRIAPRPNGGFDVIHDPRITGSMGAVGGDARPELLTAPMILHASDHDFYSTPAWNLGLCSRVVAAGGKCRAFIYPGATHGLAKSPHAWFSPPGTEAGFSAMLDRDLAFFGANRKP